MRYPDHYILVKRVPIAVDVMSWARWFEKNAAACRVAETKIGDVRVSTVFLGLNHNFADDGPPILFETMVFGDPHNGEIWRYESWKDAEIGHQEAVDAVRRHHDQNRMDR